ncbi:hypothetical protein ACJ73_10199, partial [Blastomyces percursus]
HFRPVIQNAQYPLLSPPLSRFRYKICLPLDFSSLHKIVTLRLPAHCLLTCLSSTQVLPRTLERLDVAVVGWVDRGHLSKLMVEYIKQKPVEEGIDAWALKLISIDSRVAHWTFNGVELSAVCKEKGVKLELYQVELQGGHEPWGY